MQYITLDHVNIPVNAQWNSIAIAVSGGADSALLAFLLSKWFAEHNPSAHIHYISHIRMWKSRPWQQYDSQRVYEYMCNKFTLKTSRHVNLIAPDIEYGRIGPSIMDEYGKMVSGDNIQQRAYSEYVCIKNSVQCFYNAVTRNPKSIQLAGSMSERDIDRDASNAHKELSTHLGFVASHPFRFTDKSWVLRQYRQHHIMDLFDITRSCEGEFADIDYRTYKTGQIVPVCGSCFWCLERNWAVEITK